jgi:hypothetical protein
MPATGQQKTSLFDNIVGYEDVKALYKLAIKARKTCTSASSRITSISQVIIYELAY